MAAMHPGTLNPNLPPRRAQLGAATTPCCPQGRDTAHEGTSDGIFHPSTASKVTAQPPEKKPAHPAAPARNDLRRLAAGPGTDGASLAHGSHRSACGAGCARAGTGQEAMAVLPWRVFGGESLSPSAAGSGRGGTQAGG